MPEKFTQVLPSNWDGTFKFTNDSDEEFIFTWAKKAYLFPARMTVDMMRMNFNATPLEVMQIRKFAATRFAEREFFKSDSAKKMESIEKDEHGNSKLMNFQAARSYSLSDLTPFIQSCLTPLPETTALVADAPGPNTEDLLHKDDETGKFITPVIENQKASLSPGEILLNN